MASDDDGAQSVEGSLSDENFDDDYEDPGPGLEPHEYVVGRINIEKTLASSFYLHAMRQNSPRTFKIVSEETAARAWVLVREFLARYNWPKEGSNGNVAIGGEEWRCPRFVPHPRLMFVRKVYGGQSYYGWRADVRELIVEAAGTPVDKSAKIFKLDIPAYTSVRPTTPSRADYDVILTEPAFPAQYSIYQNIYASEYCTIGDVAEGNRIVINPTSASKLGELQQRAKVQVENLYLPGGHYYTDEDLRTQPDCGCSKMDYAMHPQERDIAIPNFDDIVLDFCRPTCQDLDRCQNTDRALSFGEEEARTRRLLDHWIAWIIRR